MNIAAGCTDRDHSPRPAQHGVLQHPSAAVADVAPDKSRGCSAQHRDHIMPVRTSLQEAVGRRDLRVFLRPTRQHAFVAPPAATGNYQG